METDKKFDFPKMPGLVIAYHGCDKEIANKVVAGTDRIKDSVNPYDWLGHGQYFWEGSKQRAYEWAVELCKRGFAQTPAVIGAVIDLGMCLNLVDTYCINMVKSAFIEISDNCKLTGATLPQNKNTKYNNDLLLRHLDCAVIEYLRKSTGNILDTVRGVFQEGDPLYENAGFYEKTHIQICVMNHENIKGYFFPL